MSTPIRSKVYAKINAGNDAQIHVKVTRADGLEFVNLREFIVSLKQYGRGVMFETHLLPQVIEELQELERQIGTRPTVVSGQQSLPGMESA